MKGSLTNATRDPGVASVAVNSRSLLNHLDTGFQVPLGSTTNVSNRKGSSGTYVSSRPSLDMGERLEELAEDAPVHDYRGRPRRNIRRRTYNEGSSQEDIGSGFSYGTGISGWDRSVTGLTTDDDEGV
jgi:hypothetical protein